MSWKFFIYKQPIQKEASKICWVEWLRNIKKKKNLKKGLHYPNFTYHLWPNWTLWTSSTFLMSQFYITNPNKKTTWVHYYSANHVSGNRTCPVIFITYDSIFSSQMINSWNSLSRFLKKISKICTNSKLEKSNQSYNMFKAFFIFL